ncbi:MAG TPA: PepSY domain-containing protein [Opitutaceae bacterium]|nr:PepSY domain-containing protein [Opitutaceae bacterium]
MNKSIQTLVAAGTMMLAFVSVGSLSAEEAMAKASIRPVGKVKEADLPALAKITMADALKAALAKAPGSAVKAELEVEDGNLVYSFEIVGTDKSITEVEVDAGDAKILGVDKEK